MIIGYEWEGQLIMSGCAIWLGQLIRIGMGMILLFDS